MNLDNIETVSDDDILSYLSAQSVFRDTNTIYRALNKSNLNRAVIEGQLVMLTAKHKLLAVKTKDRYVYSMPEKLKSGKVLSGVLDSDTYLILTCAVD